MMKNTGAYIITVSRVKEEAHEDFIYLYLSLRGSSPHRLPPTPRRNQRLSSQPPSYPRRATFTRLLYFLFLRFSRKVTPGQSRAGSKFPLETRQLQLHSAIVSVGRRGRARASAHTGKVRN